MAAVARMSLAWRAALWQSVNEKKGVADHGPSVISEFFACSAARSFPADAPFNNRADRPVKRCRVRDSFAFAIAKIRL
jgi:hypothetical protein